jgi:hypothetical protein
MEEKNKAIEANAQAIAPVESVKVTIDEDLEARNVALEAEKAKVIEERENYRIAYLKEKNKKEGDGNEDERLRTIAREELANSRLADIAREQDSIIKKALKENKELKLAQMNKADIPVSQGGHSEGQPVKDTMVTSEQLAAFKARGWNDKDIERYKKNLQRYSGR